MNGSAERTRVYGSGFFPKTPGWGNHVRSAEGFMEHACCFTANCEENRGRHHSWERRWEKWQLHRGLKG